METAAGTVTTAPTSSARSGRVDMAAACRIRGRRTRDVRQRWTWLDTDTLGRVADPESASQLASGVTSLAELAGLLRQLRRREARRRGGTPLTYRELATRTGWSHAIVGQYLSGNVLPPTDRFDTLVRLLGAAPAEQGALATARDRVQEARRAGRTSEPVPRQLPPDVRGFAGRDSALTHLDGLLSGPTGTVVISAVSGTAGVGKTALAVHWAHRVADRYPDGQLYVNLRGYDPSGTAMGPDEAVRGFLDAMGVPADRVPSGLTE